MMGLINEITMPTRESLRGLAMSSNLRIRRERDTQYTSCATSHGAAPKRGRSGNERIGIPALGQDGHSQPPAPGNSLPTTQPIPAARQQSSAPILPTTTIIRPAFRSRASKQFRSSMWVTSGVWLSLLPFSVRLGKRWCASSTESARRPLWKRRADKRVSNSRLDNDLRHISLLFDRLTEPRTQVPARAGSAPD